MFSLEKKRLRGDLFAAFHYGKGHKEQEGNELFTRVDSERTRGNGSKLSEGRRRVDARRKCFTEGVLTYWNRLPRELGDAPSLEIFAADDNSTGPATAPTLQQRRQLLQVS